MKNLYQIVSTGMNIFPLKFCLTKVTEDLWNIACKLLQIAVFKSTLRIHNLSGHTTSG